MNTFLQKKYYDISKLTIWGEGDGEGENKRPRLVLSFRDGNPRFVVYTGLQGKEGVINFPCDAIHMTASMLIMEDIIKGEPGEKLLLDSLRTLYQNDKPTNEKQVAATLHIGKSKDGIMYFSVISADRPKIVFPIKPSPFHTFRDAAKTVHQDSYVSQKLALGVIKIITDIIPQIMIQYANEEYENGKKQGSTDTRGGEAAGQAAAGGSSGGNNRNLVQDLDDLVL